MEQMKNQIEDVTKAMEALAGDPGVSVPREGDVFRKNAAAITNIGCMYLKGMLLRRCFAVAEALVDFADELDEPAD